MIVRRAMVLLVALVTASVSSAAGGRSALPVATAAVPVLVSQLRVDQAGYLPQENKTGYLLSAQPLPAAEVDVLDGTGRSVARGSLSRRAVWSSRFPYVYSVDFSRLSRAGSYHLQVRGTAVRSPNFPVLSAARLWGPILRKGVTFDQLQRDGRSVISGQLPRQSAHLNDRAAQTYRWPTFEDDSDVITNGDLTKSGGVVDVEGGWSDAGDYLKFSHSTAYADVLLYTSARDLGRSAPSAVLAEARHGSDWLAKMWDRQSKTLYLQVGIGSGNAAGSFTGDHDLWRLPDGDDAQSDPANRYATTHRPVFRAADPGAPISPNLAGRISAAFALAAQADARSHPQRAREELADATSLYGMADTTSPPEPLVTALPHAFYPESTWHDDMELGAVEIARAARLLHRPSRTTWTTPPVGPRPSSPPTPETPSTSTT